MGERLVGGLITPAFNGPRGEGMKRLRPRSRGYVVALAAAMIIFAVAAG